MVHRENKTYFKLKMSSGHLFYISIEPDHSHSIVHQKKLQDRWVIEEIKWG